MSSKTVINFWLGVFTLVMLLWFGVRCYEVGFERGCRATFEEVKAPLPGQLHVDMTEKKLYAYDGEAKEWIKLCELCEAKP